MSRAASRVGAGADLVDDRGQGAGGELAGRVAVRVARGGRGRVEDPVGREHGRQQPERRDPHHTAAALGVVHGLRAELRDLGLALACFRQRVEAGRCPALGGRRATARPAASRPARQLGPGRVCVSSQRSYACCTTATVKPSPRSVRTPARISPSTVNSVIWVSSVIVPGGQPAEPETKVRDAVRGARPRSTGRPGTRPAHPARPRSPRPAGTREPAPATSLPPPDSCRNPIDGGASATPKTGSRASSPSRLDFYGRWYRATDSSRSA